MLEKNRLANASVTLRTPLTRMHASWVSFVATSLRNIYCGASYMWRCLQREPAPSRLTLAYSYGVQPLRRPLGIHEILPRRTHHVPIINVVLDRQTLELASISDVYTTVLDAGGYVSALPCEARCYLNLTIYCTASLWIRSPSDQSFHQTNRPNT